MRSGIHIAVFARAVTACLLPFWFLAAPAAASPTNSAPSRTIGIEGRVSVELPRGDYRPLPLDDRTELILRLENVTPLSGGKHRYDFYYMGFEPGPYNLANYLMRPDGSRPDELEDIRIQVSPVLSDNFNGQLSSYVPRLFPWFGGYRALLALIAVLWVGGIAAFILTSRKKRVVEVEYAVAPQPSLAERLRPLVEAASAGKLTGDGQAQLERLMMGYWREKLELPEQRMAEALARLKAHAEAGQLLRALEGWLHRPGGSSPEQVSSLLEPYRHAPTPATATGGAA
jgi:hypothetical protein